MPSFSRKCIVNPEVVGTYHCTSRCVRRAYLCGYDQLHNANYDHRKEWIKERMDMLSQCFFVDVGSYAIMCNHFHLNIRIRPDLVNDASDEEIVERWWRLFPRISCITKKKPISVPESIRYEWLNDKKWLMERRRRLCSLSWFMRCLCEYVARKANMEDGVTGRFWEGRFKSQALLDDAAVLAAGIYVDLNPIRAGRAMTPEDSKYSSVQDRIRSMPATNNNPRDLSRGSFLSPIYEKKSPEEDLVEPFLDMKEEDYIELVDWYGRQLVQGKRGSIPQHLPNIFERIGVKIKHDVNYLGGVFKKGSRAIGSESSLRRYASNIGQKWVHGVGPARLAFA